MVSSPKVLTQAGASRAFLVHSSIALLLFFLTGYLVLQFPASPKVVLQSAPDTVFSAERAFEHVKQICSKPHSVGTPQHAIVRHYIIEALNALNIPTTIDTATSVRSLGPVTYAGEVYNIMATLKGTGGGRRKILLIAHYDTPPNSLGAADDGAGVATLLETARMLVHSLPLKNDVQFLFSDSEENGLLGAHEFAQSVDLTQVGLIINLEARGSYGPSIMFETTPDNGVVIAEYARASSYAVANSLTFEIYKMLPNETDYSVFKARGIPGFNHAFIDGYVNYHSMNDRPSNLDLRSLQHHGRNVIDLVLHFGNHTLENLKGTDRTYFNIFGVFVHYPKWIDILVVVLVITLAGLTVRLIIKNEKCSIKGILVCTFLWPVVIAAAFYLIKLLQQLIHHFYPLYRNFNSGGSYNVHGYFILLSAIAFLAIAGSFILISLKYSVSGVIASTFIFMSLVLVALHLFLPTGSYILAYPLGLASLVQLILLSLKHRVGSNSPVVQYWHLLISIGGIAFLLPVIKTLFIAFALGNNAPFIGILLFLISGFTMLFVLCIHRGVRIFLLLATGTLIPLMIIWTHNGSSFDVDRPLLTSLRYVIDADSSEAKWTTSAINFGNASYFPTPNLQSKFGIDNDAPLFDIGQPSFLVLSDSSSNKIRKVKLRCVNGQKGSSFFMAFVGKNKVHSVFIDGKESRNGSDFIYAFSYFGCRENGFILELELDNGPLDFIVEELSIGLDALPFYAGLPDGAVHSPDYSSNTISVRKVVSL